MKKNIIISVLCLIYFGNTAQATEKYYNDDSKNLGVSYKRMNKVNWIPIMMGDLITFVPNHIPIPLTNEKIFLVDIQKGIATNTKIHKVWQNKNIRHGDRTKALKICKNLNFAGITSWRLPTSSESKYFHLNMNLQGNIPKQAFSKCTAEVTSDGYVRTKRGADKYGGKPGDSINFSGGANIRCVSGSTVPSSQEQGNSGSGDSVPPTLDATTKQAYLDAINYVRGHAQDCGSHGVKPAVPALVWNDRLYKASWQHSNDLAKTNTFSHTGSGQSTDRAAQASHPGRGSNVSERIEYTGYTNWRANGENIAAGTVMDQAQEAIDGWVDSDGHCANLMSPNFTEVGMAHVYDANSHYTHYWTQDFGKR